MTAPSAPSRLRIEPADTVLLKGRDVVSWLQTKLTCDTRKFSLTAGGYGFATDINGRVLFDASVRLLDRAALLVVPPGSLETIRAHVDKYVIMEDVTLEPGDGWRATFVLGALPEAFGLDPLEAGAAQLDGVRVWQGSGAYGGLDGTWLVCAADDADTLDGALAARGVGLADPVAFERDEVVRGFPRVGRDLVQGETIPVEAGAWHGIATNKGCYLGQEIIERLISRGNPARRLARLRWQGAVVAPMTPILSGSDDAGFVTSSVATPGGVVGMGYVRRRFVDQPAPLAVDGQAVEVVSLVETRPLAVARPPVA